MTDRHGHDPAAGGSTTPDGPDFGHLHGWDRDFEAFSDFDLPTYVGPSTFSKLPWVSDPAELRRRGVDVAIIGAPFDDAVSHRPGARFGPRAIREANYSTGSLNSLQLGHVEPFEVLTVVDAGDANIIPAWIERGHASSTGRSARLPRPGRSPSCWGATTRSPGRRPPRSPRSAVRGASGVHFDAHADTAPEDWGVLAGTARRCGGSSRVGPLPVATSCRSASAATGPRSTSSSGCRTGECAGTSWARSRSAAPRRSSTTPSRRPSTAPTRSTCRTTSTSSTRPGARHRDAGARRDAHREVLRAIRRIVGAVELAGMDIVEVSPPYDHAEVTAAAANRCALEAILRWPSARRPATRCASAPGSGSGAPRRARALPRRDGHGRPAGDPGCRGRRRRSIWP